MMKTRKALLRGIMFLGLAASVFAGTSYAAVITYTSSATFLGAIGGSQTFDFNQPDGAISTLGSALSISTIGGDASGRVHSNALCGSSGGSVDCFNPLLFTSNQPRRAFGYDNLDFNGFEEAVVTIAFVSGPSQEFVFNLGGQPVFTPIFFGVTSDVDISTVEIYSRDPGTTAVGQRANAVDNVIIAAVPEPASLALVGLGLAGLGFSRRKAAQA